VSCPTGRCSSRTPPAYARGRHVPRRRGLRPRLLAAVVRSKAASAPAAEFQCRWGVGRNDVSIEAVLKLRKSRTPPIPDSALWTHNFPGCALFVRVSADQFAAWTHKVRARLPEVHVRALKVRGSIPFWARRSPKGMEPYPFGDHASPEGMEPYLLWVRRAQKGIEPRTLWARGIPERDGTFPFRVRRAQKGIGPRTLWARGIPERDGTFPERDPAIPKRGPQRAAPGIRSGRRARNPSKISYLAAPERTPAPLKRGWRVRAPLER
jgi:hypothetical protein